jgi:HK97 family phage major capsid protein
MAEPTLEEYQKAVEEVNNTFTDFKKVVEERDKTSGSKFEEIDAKLDKMSESMDKQEVIIADFHKAREKKEEEYKLALETAEKRVDELEAKWQRPGHGAGEELKQEDFFNEQLFLIAKNDDKHFERKAAFDPALRSLWSEAFALTPEQKVLTVADPTTGGYLAPPELVSDMIREVVDVTPAMQVATVRTTTRGEVRFPKRTGIPTMIRVAESGTRSETSGLTFAAEEIRLPEAYGDIRVTRQDLEDVDFPLEAEIRDVLALMASVLMGTEFITGAGIQALAMEGLSVNGDISNTASGASGDVAAATLIDFVHALPEQYHAGARFLFRFTTLAALRKMTGSDGHFLWAPGMGSTPATFLGYPYTICPDVPAVGASAVCMYFGNFKNGYYIVMRSALDVQRLIELYAASGQIGFLGRIRFGGQVVNAEAIEKYTCGA